jgi:PAT family beta-lactamase induction signal transducer AmpG
MQRRSLFALSTFVAIFYFSEGLPNGIITELFPIYLRQSGVSLTNIGLLSTLGFAWTLKFFWSPLVDTFGNYRQWITASLAVLSAALIPFVFSDLAHSPMLWVLLAVLTLASATQDIAVDAYTISATPREHIGIINSIRITAYRIGLILAGGALAVVASRWGWPAAFATSCAVSVLLFFVSFFLPPREQTRAGGSLFADLREWIARPQAGGVLAVLLLYRVGDSVLSPMVKPFWVDRGYSAGEIGTVTTVIGVSFTILGGIVGGLFINRFGIYWALLWLGALQMASNLGYAWAASTDPGRTMMYTAALVEAFCGGLGTSAFLAFLMSICDRTRAATEYALLSGLYALSRYFIGSISGILADSMGYAEFFWLSVALGIPGLLVLPFVKKRIPPRFSPEDDAVPVRPQAG